MTKQNSLKPTLTYVDLLHCSACCRSTHQLYHTVLRLHSRPIGNLRGEYHVNNTSIWPFWALSYSDSDVHSAYCNAALPPVERQKRAPKGRVGKHSHISYPEPLGRHYLLRPRPFTAPSTLSLVLYQSSLRYLCSLCQNRISLRVLFLSASSSLLLMCLRTSSCRYRSVCTGSTMSGLLLVWYAYGFVNDLMFSRYQLSRVPFLSCYFVISTSHRQEIVYRRSRSRRAPRSPEAACTTDLVSAAW